MNLFHIESLSPLYETIQTSEIFPDSKFFVDCTPLYSTAKILEHYQNTKEQAGFDLKTFVKSHFSFPKEMATDYQSAEKPLAQHLSDLWEVLKRTPDDDAKGTLIPLPFPYIVPGGRFREVYYWDSYFTMLGLASSGRVDIIENMVDNFAHLIHHIGFIPNGNRTYYLGRSQPPFFALMVSVLAEIKGFDVFLKYQTALEKEYHFWMNGSENLSDAQPSHHRVVRLPNGSLLNRYWDDNATPRPEAYIEDVHIAKKATQNDPSVVYRHIRAAAESGWDFSSRWFVEADKMETIRTTNLLPVDLNCLLLYLEQTLLSIYKHHTEGVLVKNFEEKIAQRKAAIQSVCWDTEQGFYFDYDFVKKQTTGIQTLAAVYPLFFKVADGVQAAQVAQNIETHFLKSGGVVTTLAITGQQWDAPNGWAPLQWMTYKGCQNYGFDVLAAQIRHNWMQNGEKVYAETGKMMEKYNVMDSDLKAGGGEYPNQDGFGWTNGVYLKWLLTDK